MAKQKCHPKMVIFMSLSWNDAENLFSCAFSFFNFPTPSYKCTGDIHAIYPPAALMNPCVPTAGIKQGSRAAAPGITFYCNTAARGKLPGLALALWHPRGQQCPGCTRVSGHMWAGHLAGNFVLSCCARCFPGQQSSFYWLSQVSEECPA